MNKQFNLLPYNENSFSLRNYYGIYYFYSKEPSSPLIQEIDKSLKYISSISVLSSLFNYYKKDWVARKLSIFY